MGEGWLKNFYTPKIGFRGGDTFWAFFVQVIKSVQKFTFKIFRFRSTFIVQILEQFKRSFELKSVPFNFKKTLKFQ